MNDPKGLAGPVSIQDAHGTELTGWRVLKAAGADDAKAGPPDAGAAGWQDYKIGDDPFGHQRGYAWFQTTIPPTVGASYASLHFGSVDDNGTVFVNGKQVATHQGWDSAFDVPVPPGPAAVVTVFVENVDGTGGLGKPVTLIARTGRPVVASGWKLRGGPGDPLSPSGWKRLGAARGSSAAPPSSARRSPPRRPPRPARTRSGASSRPAWATARSG